MKMRSIYVAVLSAIFVALGVQCASARWCLLEGPSYSLRSETIQWSLRTQGGRDCIRGLRSAGVILNKIEVITPPKAGEVVISGPALTFIANQDAAGDDTFTIRVTGRTYGMEGTSTIVIKVLYNDVSNAASTSLQAENGAGR